MFISVTAISLGATLGALLRWLLSLKYNSVFSAMPLGTLMANLIGGYVVGLAIAYFSQASGISSEWRLFIVTGFCGGLTTFSTFSAEVVFLLQQGRFAWAIGVIAAHVAGSLIMTIAGLASWHYLKAG